MSTYIQWCAIKGQECTHIGKNTIDLLTILVCIVFLEGKVYAILTGQLLVTVLSILTFGMNPKLTLWIMNQAPIGK